jgi:hypothetical protein
MKHKHYDLIVAWAEGKQIQVKAFNKIWDDRENPYWCPDREYRIKPEPKPESELVHETELKLLVRDFFDEYLDIVEESDSGRLFNPIRISCLRSMKTEPLSKLLERMRELSH